MVSLSTIEAKFIVVASCACQAIWLKRLLQKMDGKKDEAMVIHCDSSFLSSYQKIQ